MRRGPKTGVQQISLVNLIEAGVIQPPMEIERTFLGKRLTARIETDGSVTFRGKKYPTLSRASCEAKKFVQNNKHEFVTSNGWDFWKCREEGKVVPIGTLRRHLVR